MSSEPQEPEWEHLKPFGYAPGNYMNRCTTCGEVVEGVDKRAITCRPCAEKLHAARPWKSVPVTTESVGGNASAARRPLTKTEFARLWREHMGATRFTDQEWAAKLLTERAHGIEAPAQKKGGQ